MGGVWERMIGITRRILDSLMLGSGKKQFTHESLTTFMAEVCAIINSRPLGQISSDPESPLVLSLSMLLTGKTDHLLMVSDSYDLKDMYRAQWKHVQALSDIFWREWRVSYLQSLQARRKWFTTTPNLKDGDIVLLKDKAAQRISWPLGIVVKALPSEDGNFRKACVRIYKDGKTVTYIRPINEMVLLLK